MKRYIATGIMALIGYNASMGITTATAVTQEQQTTVVTGVLTETVTETAVPTENATEVPAENTMAPAESENPKATGFHTSKSFRITAVVIIMLLFITSPLWGAALTYWDISRSSYR